MTPQEAIHFLKETIAGCHILRDRQLKAVCEVSINALEKQMPKKPYYFGDGYDDGMLVYDEARCPACECDFEEGMTNWGCEFCPDCGQALDWSDTE